MATEPTSGMTRLKLPLFVIIGLVVGFLAGFIVQYSRTSDYSDLKKQQRLLQLCDELVQAHLQVMNKNFGQAQAHSTKFFNDLRAIVVSTKDEDLKNKLWPFLQRRDAITTALTQASPAAEKELRDLLNEVLQTARTQSP
jgi:hypothetical protein